MSECVVRMEMPTKDRMCQMADDIDGVWYCPVMKKLCRQPDNGEMPSWCPIICSLPEGHGRLVDADLFKRHLHTAWAIDEISYAGLRDLMRRLNDAPTIVPAEAERRKQDAD